MLNSFLIENACKLSELRKENLNLKQRLIDFSPKIVTRSKRVKDLCNQAKRLAVTDLPVLICGKNGAGKEVLADYIHINSSRSSLKMLKINCAAFPEYLLDNELFGHEKGAYTGADSRFKGVFEKAHNSTLFLDEIGDMSSGLQAKILRTLQDHEIRRLGGNEVILVNVRFIAATNKDLKKLINKNRFRRDLFYRLNAATLYLPPLRERKEDISLLTDHFLRQYSQDNSVEKVQVSDRVLDKFLDYSWPGNIRELKNTVYYAAAMSVKDPIDLEDLPPPLRDVQNKEGIRNIREEVEKDLIIRMLQKSSFNKKRTAELLHISRKTLYNKLDKYGISY